jgi:amino acid permease
MTLFTGITPLFGSSFAYTGPAGVVWGWVIVSFFTWFVGFAMAEICSSFPVRTEKEAFPFHVFKKNFLFKYTWDKLGVHLIKHGYI